ncbi:hypothetical protein H5410_039868 [Solanum commersonii]|uniref:DUF4283 domain-containing protein n=1 Tax=Solanum commersonii TaxID=4109 RepID=A0A9J5XNF4_SOLCO|nr:hypothetical protein H5410_039868 [Solanum commersonii]
MTTNSPVLCPPTRINKPIPLKPISYLHGEPRIVWEEEEVKNMIIKENLEFAVIGKFSYGWPEIQELRKLILKQCEMRGECNIGLLSNRHVLIRTSCLEDYVSLLSKPAHYLSHRGWSYPMQTLKWDLMFDPRKETSRAITWISFPALPPNFFVKEVVFSLAAAVGKPLQVDLATKNQTRPSCARVKVEVDLFGEFPKRINVGVRKQSGEVVEKWIRIKYDYGHNEQECYIIHRELYPKKEKNEVEECSGGKGDTYKKQLVEHPVERRETIQNIDEVVFQEQKKKKGGWERKTGLNKLQVWYPKHSQKERADENTGNMDGGSFQRKRED